MSVSNRYDRKARLALGALGALLWPGWRRPSTIVRKRCRAGARWLRPRRSGTMTGS